MHPFGERCEARRLELNLTISQLCRTAGIGRPTYHAALKRVPPRSGTVEMIAFALQCDPETLLAAEDLTPTPYTISLRRCADLLRPDSDGQAKAFADAVELLWRARFQGPGDLDSDPTGG